MFGMAGKTLHYWYKNILSDYLLDKQNGNWCSKKIDTVNKRTGEIIPKPVYVLKPENLGAHMSIDDKAIGHDGFTLLSNNDTGKIAMMVESTQADGVEQLSKEKTRTGEDKKILAEIELLRRVSHAITQSPDKWNDEMQETMEQVFISHQDLKNAWKVSQNFKQWYAYENAVKPTENIKNDLQQWYLQAMKISEYESVLKMIRKHDPEIINHFKHGLTNAKAENLNGKLQRFVSANYGLKDKDFFIYRVAGYFS